MIHAHMTSDLPNPPEKPRKNGFSRLKMKLTAIIIFVLIFLFIEFGRNFFCGSKYISYIYDFLFVKGILFFVLTPFFLFCFIKYLKYKKIIAEVPTSKIRSASMGMVEIKGVARRKYNLLSPVAKLPCIYYRVKKYRRGDAGQEAGWIWYETEVSGSVPFSLEEETGRCLVYPEGGEFFPLKKETHINTGGCAYVPGICFCVPANEKWEEELILDNSPLYILGWAEYPFQSGRSVVKRIRLDILRRIKADKNLLMRYDEDKNGEIDQYEWEKAVSDADREATKIYLKSGEGKKETFVLLDPPYRGFPMIIAATKIEEKIIKKYSLYMKINLLASLISFTLGSIMLFGK